MSYDLDFSQFNRGMKEAARRTMDGAETGMGRAAIQLMNDAVMEEPTVPLLEGWLRGSGSAFVQNKLAAVSTHGPKAGEGAVRTLSDPIESGEVVGTVGYNTPYAAKVHEDPHLQFTEPSAGTKYLEAKMAAHRDDYMELIAEAIQEELNR